MQIIPGWFHNAKMLKPFPILLSESWVCQVGCLSTHLLLGHFQHPSHGNWIHASSFSSLWGAVSSPSSSCHFPHQPGARLGHHLLLWLIPTSSHSGSAQIWSQSKQCVHSCPPCWTLPWASAGCDGWSGSPHGSALAISQPSRLTLSPLLGLPLNPHLIPLNRSSLPSLSKPLIQNWGIG